MYRRHMLNKQCFLARLSEGPVAILGGSASFLKFLNLVQSTINVINLYVIVMYLNDLINSWIFTVKRNILFLATLPCCIMLL